MDGQGSGSKELAAKLELARKSLNLGRGALAAVLEVDKSVVSRWLSGATVPSAHNLARLTAVIAERRDGFTLLDWDRSLPELAAALGVEQAPREGASAGGPDEPLSMILPPRAIQATRRETARRGRSFEGLWRITQPAFTQPGRLVHAHGLIREKDGLLRMSWGAPGWLCSGSLLLVMGQLFGVLADEADDTILFCVLNGVSMPRVETLDGLMLTNAKDGPQTPTAAACVLERIGDLSGDEAGDEGRYHALRESPDALAADDALRAHILRDVGPEAFAAGGDLLLRSPLHRSLSRGGPVPGW